MPRASRPLHYFNDLLDRLPKEVKAALFKVPFPDIARFKADPMQATGEALDAIAGANRILDSSDSYPVDAVSFCLRHKALCHVHLPVDPGQFTEVWAGLECYDFSRIGLKAGFSGASTRSALSWGHERKYWLESLIMTECSDEWDPVTLENLLSETHDINKMIICPSDFGWPISRPRTWTVNPRNDHMTLECSFQEFCKELGWFKVCMLAGSDLFCESPDVVHDELMRLSTKRGALPHEAAWEHTLTGAQMIRLQSARDSKHERRQSSSGAPGTHTWVADLDHNYTSRISKTDLVKIPCLLRHGTIWLEVPPAATDDERSVHCCRPMLKREVLSCQGCACIPHARGMDFLVPWSTSVLGEFTDTEVAQLAGNAMHLQVVMMLQLWVLCCARPISDHNLASSSSGPTMRVDHIEIGSDSDVEQPTEDLVSISSSPDHVSKRRSLA